MSTSPHFPSYTAQTPPVEQRQYVSNPFFDAHIPLALATGTEPTEPTLTHQRPSKRKRFEIEPECETDSFYRTPLGYETSTEAIFDLPSFAMDTEPSFDNPLSLNPPHPLLDLNAQGSTLTEQEIDDFVNFISEPNQPPPMFNMTGNLWNSDLQDGTPITIVNKLEEINCSRKHMENQLDCLRFEQNQMLVPPPQAEFEKFNSEQTLLMEDCKLFQKELDLMINSALISPAHLFKLHSLQQDFDILQTRLHLYQSELHYMASIQSQSESKCFATLVVKKQPFPKSIKQHTKATSALEDPTVVELIKAPKADCKPCGLVKTELLSEETSTSKRGKRNSFSIKNDQQKMDDSGVVRFTDLRFPQGTKLKPVQLRFAVEVQFIKQDGSVGKELLESNPTSPFIVMTNENQWESSEAVLIKHDLFQGSVPEVSWFKFANLLQVYYLKATRQDPAKPARPLSKYDLEYLHREKFNGRMSITMKDFDIFWDWYGKVLHKIRHQKPFVYLWLQGLVYGFLSKPDAEQLLHLQPHGTVVARFSERRAGQIALAFSKKNLDNGRIEIKHYLVDSNSTKAPSLADFLRDHENLLYIPKVRTEFFSNEGPIACVMAKDDALKDYYSKSKWNPLAGYADSVR